MAKYELRAAVHRDLLDIWTFIARDNPAAARRVIEEIYRTFAVLAEAPKIGKLRQFRSRHLKGIRSWRVSGFDRYHVFYRTVPDGIQALHVLHDARDIEALFGTA